MKRNVTIAAFLLVACASPSRSPAPAPGAAPLPGPFSVVLFIGDGTGLSYWSAAKHASAELAVESFPVVGLVDTRASDSRVTDSAAGATAYAAGVRTFNGAIGVGPDSAAVRTVLELAESRGMATGLVATSTLTHATPASFVAHVPSRTLHFEIAAAIAERDIEVLLGGGKRFFDAAVRPDSQDLLTPLLRGAAYVETPDAFYGLDADTIESLVGFFAENNPGPAVTRQPSLPEMTAAALDVLAHDEDGFFLMVEGSQIDWRGHENAPLQEVIAEVLDFDMAIGRALAFQRSRPNTLILVVADHSTGGLALHGDAAGVFRAHYTTEGHTAEMVPLFAAGPGDYRFGGVRDNYVVGRLLLEMVRRGGPSGGGPQATTRASGAWTPSLHSPRP